jgi:pyruvate formate lyase activating enzyme
MNQTVIGNLYNIQPFSVQDGPGIRTTVFLKGCPLSCLWCHSPESQSTDWELSYLSARCVGTDVCGRCLEACPEHAISANCTSSTVAIDRTRCTACLHCTEVCTAKALMPSGYHLSVEEVFERIVKDKPYYEPDGGVTISGGEPMQQFSFTYALAKQCNENGISVCLDTTGYAPEEDYLSILPYIDLFLYDLKQMDSHQSEKLTGVPNEQILSNAESIAAHGGNFQIRVPIIPKLNDTEENLRRTAQFCVSLGEAVTDIQLLPYHNMGIGKYERIGRTYPLKNISPPTDDEMLRHLALFESYHLPVHLH